MGGFARICAARDAKEAGGGHRHGGWGAAVVFWAATMRHEHAGCGPLDRSGVTLFGAGDVDAPFVVCPVHGKLVGPEMPK